MSASPNRLNEVVIISICVGVVLLLLSFFNSSFSVGNLSFKKVDVLADLRVDTIPSVVFTTPPVVIDSAAIKDSTDYALLMKNPASIIDFGADSAAAMEAFFNSLLQTKTKKKKTRIAYFGDSMIEGDLITQDFRTTLQDTFGGVGVGYVPITSIVAGFRQTIFHTFSGFTTHTLLDAVSTNHPLSISGYSYSPTAVNVDSLGTVINQGIVKYVAPNRSHINTFPIVKLFYGNSTEGNYVAVGDRKIPLSGTNIVNQAIINNYPVSSVTAKFQCNNKITLYGFSMESDSGVYVDNYSFRGNSGLPLTKIPSNVLTQMNSYLNYDLIILHYGVNVVNAKVTDYSWYERGMLDVVNHFKKAMPNTSILLVSTGDKSIRKNGKYETDPSIPLVIETQKRVAQKTGVAFWNLYEAMGGYNSMVKWVQGDTVLANRDYTHPNFRGAKKVADLLYKHLMAQYAVYAKKDEIKLKSITAAR